MLLTRRSLLFVAVVQWCCSGRVLAGKDYSKYFQQYSIPSRIRAFDAAHNLPGNKQSDANPSAIRGFNLPNHKTQTSNGLADFRPFDNRLGLGVNRDAGDSFGLGFDVAPNGNPHNIPIDMMYPSIIANGGTLPNFEENPLIGPFNPFATGFGVGVAHENINTNFAGSLKFPDLKTKKMFDLGGAFTKNARYLGGEIDIPLMQQGQKMLLDGMVTFPNTDVQVSYSHSAGNTNALDIPIDQYYPYIVANPQILYPRQSIPVVLNAAKRRKRKVTVEDILYPERFAKLQLKLI